MPQGAVGEMEKETHMYLAVISLGRKPCASHTQYLISCIRPGCGVPMSSLFTDDRATPLCQSHVPKGSWLGLHSGCYWTDTR